MTDPHAAPSAPTLHRTLSSPMRLDASAPDAVVERGLFGDGDFARLLVRLYRARFTGVLAVTEEEDRARLFFDRGMLVAARASARSADLGRIVVDLGLAAPGDVDAAVDEARRAARLLGDVLIRNGIVDAVGIEHALREQLVRRAVSVGQTHGAWELAPDDVLGLAGSTVHPAAVTYRLGAEPAALGAAWPADAADRLHVEVAGFAAIARAADPEGALAVTRALVDGGARLGDVRAHGCAGGNRLLGLLHAFSDVRLSEEPPSSARRQRALANIEVDGRAADIAARHRALAGATHYTVLSLDPTADARSIEAAADSLAAELAPDALPVGFDATTRRRAAALRARALEAARTLADPERRAAYDMRLAAPATVSDGVPFRPVTDLGAEDHAVLQAARGRDAFRRGAYVTASALLLLALQLEGEDADILAMLGWARHRACPEDPGAGEDQLRRAIALDPQNEGALTYLGRLIAARGARDEARELLRASLFFNHAYGPARDALREIER